VRKRIAIVGGGFTGLACGINLVDQGFQVTIFEADEKCGGLAGGFYPSAGSGQAWRWSLESFYHHVFTNDKDIIRLAEKVNCPIQIKVPITSSFVHNKEIQLDSPLSLLRFSGINFLARLRMGMGLGLLKIIPNGLFLEKYRAVDVLPRLLGRGGYEAIWEKLLKAKFGPYVDQVNMAWFWSRVAKRTQKLGYFEGGFGGLVEKMVEYIEEKGGVVRVESEIATVRSTETRNDTNRMDPRIREDDNVGVTVDGEGFDAVVMTIPAPVIKNLVPEIDFPKIDYLWGQTLVLELSKKLIQSYWLNILEDKWPFLVVVEHTNMIDKKYYGGNALVYLGNYLPEGHQQLKMTKEQLLKLYCPFIKKINKQFNKKMIKRSFLFREPYAQPVFPTNYSARLPDMRTSIRGVYLANMSMVYPFDRGTNYAVKMGNEVAGMVINDLYGSPHSRG